MQDLKGGQPIKYADDTEDFLDVSVVAPEEPEFPVNKRCCNGHALSKQIDSPNPNGAPIISCKQCSSNQYVSE